MDSLLDRLAALDAARLVAVSGALLILQLEAAWVLAALTGRLTAGKLAAAIVVGLIAAAALLYPFRLGTPSASV